MMATCQIPLEVMERIIIDLLSPLFVAITERFQAFERALT